MSVTRYFVGARDEGHELAEVFLPVTPERLAAAVEAMVDERCDADDGFAHGVWTDTGTCPACNKKRLERALAVLAGEEAAT